MRISKWFISFLILCILIFNGTIYGQEDYSQADNESKNDTLKSSVEKFKDTVLDDIHLEGQWFLGYRNADNFGVASNAFILKRGYVTVKKIFNKSFSARVTQDISVDKEGDGMGDIEIRLKYGYLRYKFNDFVIFSDPFIEFGLVHRTWLDFEEHINPYRVQDQMFLERYHVINSADYGLTFVSLLGGKIDKNYRETVNSHYPGRYGSISLGIYNGGGYHAIEQNQNKLLETRVSIRPLPELLPGLQLSYLGALGKGNTEESPDFTLNSGFLSLEDEYFTFTSTYYSGKGNQSGKSIDTLGNAISQNGYSVFGEIKFQSINLSLFGRFDVFKFNDHPVDWHNETIITGVAYHFLQGSKVLLNYERSKNIGYNTGKESYIELAVELKY